MSTEITTLAGLQRLEAAISSMIAEGAPPEYGTVREFHMPGLYVRELVVPAGTIAVGKLHKYPLFNSVVGVGEVASSNEGRFGFDGICQFQTPAGAKRALLASTDVVWTTYHAVPDGVLPEHVMAYLTEEEILCQ